MRVIAGKFKGRKLKTVQGEMTRPTGDKVKEAVFHKMGPFFAGGYCLDLFAGSGSLGIEAISRGMDKCIFIEKSSTAFRTIQKNVHLLQIDHQCEIYRNNAYRAIQILAKKQQQFDLILVDPPYERGNYLEIINKIIKENILRAYGFLYIEYSPKKEISFQSEMFELVHEKKYNSTTCVMILQKKKVENL